MHPHPGCYDHLKAGIPRSTGDRQPMRAKIPILGDEDESLEPTRAIR